jgi:hypothetical protein
MFNGGHFWERAQYGDLSATLIEDGHPSAPLAGEPFCTRSQILLYFVSRTGEPVAQVHQYLRPDGSIGLSGKPDPQLLLISGTVYGI